MNSAQVKNGQIDTLLSQLGALEGAGYANNSPEVEHVKEQLSKLTLEFASDVGDLVDDVGTAAKSHYPLSMKTFARVVGTLSQHHDHHVSTHHQVDAILTRIEELENEVATLKSSQK